MSLPSAHQARGAKICRLHVGLDAAHTFLNTGRGLSLWDGHVFAVPTPACHEALLSLVHTKRGCTMCFLFGPPPRLLTSVMGCIVILAQAANVGLAQANLLLHLWPEKQAGRMAGMLSLSPRLLPNQRFGLRLAFPASRNARLASEGFGGRRKGRGCFPPAAALFAARPRECGSPGGAEKEAAAQTS